MVRMFSCVDGGRDARGWRLPQLLICAGMAGWYLTQLSTMIYVPFFACMAGTGITQQAGIGFARRMAPLHQILHGCFWLFRTLYRKTAIIEFGF